MKTYNSNLCYLSKVVSIYHINIIEMAQFLRTQSTFYLHFKTNFNLKNHISIHLFPFCWFHFNLNAWFVKDCKQIFTISFTCNTQKQLFNRNSLTFPMTFFFYYKYRYENNPEHIFYTTGSQHPHHFKN